MKPDGKAMPDLGGLYFLFTNHRLASTSLSRENVESFILFAFRDHPGTIDLSTDSTQQYPKSANGNAATAAQIGIKK